jgi:muconolactone delta-isomerase
MKHLLLAVCTVLPLVAGCSAENRRLVQNDEYGDWRGSSVRNRPSGASSGLVIFGVDKERQAREAAAAGGGAGLAVNAYLWRATLDTLAFMPLASADPFGGTIITDWYAPPASQNERFRAQAYVMGRQLRSDGVRVQVFRQVQERGQWVDAPVSAATNSEFEDKVLARARELRSQSAAR